MSDSEWLHAILERMQSDIEYIKADVRALRDARLKMTGAAVAVSAVVTVLVNGVMIWLRA